VNITRREFGKKIIASAAALGTSLYFPAILKAEANQESIVVVARSDTLRRIDDDIRKESAAKILNEAVMRIAGKSPAQSAWKSLFSPKETVGIKVSCLPGKKLSSSKSLVYAIVDGLRLAGLDADHIYIWERTNRELVRAGFEISRDGVQVLGTDGLSRGGYSSRIEYAGSVGTCFSRIMEKVDALVNVPVLKDHDIAGASIGMKNFFGAIYNPNKFHSNNCNPYIADLSTHRFIKDRLRLIVCDASRVQVNNGPAYYENYAWEYGGLLVSRDPVALDYLGWQIIEKRRKELNLKSLKEAGREPKYIMTADRLQLGHANERYINKLEI